MALQYPFLERVKALLDEKEKTLKWLAEEIGKSDRWFYNISDFGKLQYSEIEKISSILEKNFLEEYNQWRMSNGTVVDNRAVPGTNALTINERKISININIKAPISIVETSLSTMMATIRKEGEKLGFDIE